MCDLRLLLDYVQIAGMGINLRPPAHSQLHGEDLFRPLSAQPPYGHTRCARALPFDELYFEGSEKDAVSAPWRLFVVGVLFGGFLYQYIIYLQYQLMLLPASIATRPALTRADIRIGLKMCYC